MCIDASCEDDTGCHHTITIFVEARLEVLGAPALPQIQGIDSELAILRAQLDEAMARSVDQAPVRS